MSTKQPTSLVKFTDAETAMRVLSEAKLRWSAPHLLNDPFELSHHTTLNFDSKGLLVACVKTTLGLIFSRDEPSGNSPLIKAVRRWRDEERFDTEDEATEVLTELLSSMVKHQEPELEKVLRDWQQYSSSLRVLCLGESHENISLWEHYGHRHQGIALRFACGEDTSLEKPLAVQYRDSKPEISSLNEQVAKLMGQEDTRAQDSFPGKFLNKSKLQSKEKEWRFFRTAETASDDEGQWYEDLEFDASELRAIYFGAGIQEQVKSDILTLVQSQYPKAKQFQATVQKNRYELDFNRLNP